MLVCCVGCHPERRRRKLPTQPGHYKGSSMLNYSWIAIYTYTTRGGSISFLYTYSQITIKCHMNNPSTILGAVRVRRKNPALGEIMTFYMKPVISFLLHLGMIWEKWTIQDLFFAVSYAILRKVRFKVIEKPHCGSWTKWNNMNVFQIWQYALWWFCPTVGS